MTLLIDDRGVRRRIGYALERMSPESYISMLSDSFDSDQAKESYPFIGNTPKMSRTKGKSAASELQQYTFAVENEEFDAEIIVPKRILRRDKTDQLARKIQDLGYASVEHWADLMNELLVANGTCYDQKAFFATDHESRNSGAQSNILTADISDPTAPSAADWTTSIQNATHRLQGLLDDQGRPMNEGASQYMVFAPHTHTKELQTALGADLLLSGGAPVDNVMRHTGYSVSMQSSVRLSNESGWGNKAVLFRTDGPVRPFLRQEEWTSINSLVEGSDFAYENDAYKYKVASSRAMGFGNWQAAVRIDFS